MHHRSDHCPNPLATRSDMQRAAKQLLAAVTPYCSAGQSGIALGNFTAHYGAKVAEMEGLSRMLWGIFPLLAGGDELDDWEFYRSAMVNGSDPQHAAYWGDIAEFDQRVVEMAAFGVGLALMKGRLLSQFNSPQQQNLIAWLQQSATAIIPNNNWNYFPIMVQMGFKQAGLPYDATLIAAQFDKMEAYYLGGGWYADGPGRPRDYYISMAFHYYGLLYAALMADVDPQRAQCLRERARCFAEDFIYLFAADGSAVPFGRSLTYRFAEAAFWSAVAFAELDVFDMGTVKGLILRHLRWWLAQPIFDRDGVLSVGYAYPNLAMAEDYNAPGSPYWACKLFLVLALPAQHAFWQATERPLPRLARQRSIPQAAQILVHDAEAEHVYMLTSGQLELNNYVNTEAKYTKFAYSNLFGFTIERGRYALNHAAGDSMLLLAEQDGYYRGRRECSAVATHADYIVSHWRPWHDVAITTWLVACGDWHLRVHHINSARTLHSAEGGFAVPYRRTTPCHCADGISSIDDVDGFSTLHDLGPLGHRTATTVITPPNSNILFAETAAIPTLVHTLMPGEHWLVCAAAAHRHAARLRDAQPGCHIDETQIVVTTPQRTLTIAR